MAMKEGTKTITFRVSEELYNTISEEARKEERSINNFITYAVKKYLKDKVQKGKK